MKRLALYKAAADFAFANLPEVNAITLAENSLAAFKAGGFDQLDLATWTAMTNERRNALNLVKNQKLPSEVAAAQSAPKPTMPVGQPAGQSAAPKPEPAA